MNRHPFTSKHLVTAMGMLVGILFNFTACQQSQDRLNQRIEAERSVPPPYRVVVIEGCEYLRMEVTHGYAVLTHKGNCRNPIHCRQDTATATP